MPDRQFVASRAVSEGDLVGQLYEGVGSGPHSGVLVLHGAGGGGGYEREYGRLLADHGYAVL